MKGGSSAGEQATFDSSELQLVVDVETAEPWKSEKHSTKKIVL